jgi:polysaccharide deacetylase family protein (PEP-CTERM system associated)
MNGAAPLAAMSIDVEDWFQVENLRSAITRESWEHRELRVERNTDRMLELLAECNIRCTCFVLGWVADRCPDLIRRIASAGHEIASHGYGHELVYRLTPSDFREDVRRCKVVLEDLVSAPVVGYRAPSFSITDWSIPILQELGFEYDSSLFPALAHDRYGRIAGVGPRERIAELAPGFSEACISSLFVGSRALPWGGGGYFRFLPYPLFRRGVAGITRSGEPYVFYIHPWEIDPGQPRVTGLPRLHSFRHYVGLRSAERRFQSLLGDFAWSTVADVIAAARQPRAGTS